MADNTLDVTGRDRLGVDEVLSRAQALQEQRGAVPRATRSGASTAGVRPEPSIAEPGEVQTGQPTAQSIPIATPLGSQIGGAGDSFGDRSEQLEALRSQTPVAQQAGAASQQVSSQQGVRVANQTVSALANQQADALDEQQKAHEQLKNAGLVSGELPGLERSRKGTAKQLGQEASKDATTDLTGSNPAGQVGANPKQAGEDDELEASQIREAAETAGGARLDYFDLFVAALAWIGLRLYGTPIPYDMIQARIALFKNYEPTKYYWARKAAWLILILWFVFNFLVPLILFMTVIQVGASAACVPGLGYISNIIVKGLCN